MRILHARLLPPALVTALALVLYLLRFSYDYAASDQDELIPFLLHRLDPSLFAHDWFVQTQAGSFNVRTYVVLLLHGLALVLPVWAAVLTLYVAAWTLIATAVYHLGRLLTGDRVAAALAVVAALALTPQWTLGGNDLVHRMFVPSMLAWGLGLWGLGQALRHRTAPAALLLGLATWAQALVGLQLAGLTGLMLLADRRSASPQRRYGPARFAALYVLTAAPSVVPLLLLQYGSPPPGASPDDLFYIQAVFRTPHHYLPSAFPRRALLRFGLLLGLGSGALAWLHRRGQVRHVRRLGVLLLAMAGLCLLAVVCTELRPVLAVAELQLFKTTVLAKVILLIGIARVAAQLLPARLRRLPEALLRSRRRCGMAAVLLAALALFLMLRALEWPGLSRSPDAVALRAVEAWARTATPQDAVFAVPPSDDRFRSRAQRAIVVNFKAFPHQDTAMLAWFERLQALAPIGRPPRGGAAILDDLDRAFEHLTLAELLPLSRSYGFTYVLRRTPLPLDPVYADPSVQVYRLPDDAPLPEP
ncbi:hypothetical protein AWN76_001860 [Rhodothermaceae bacterium RA]|nr:hypothetical protein AWN76_001860 [Rhodothermaceae bacterium RA]